GAWTSATITGATATAGTLSYPVVLPGRGFYLAGNPSGAFNATVTVTLAAPADTKFNACVYASDYPPNATQQSGGGYALRGTPPFIINGTITEPSYTFGAGTCITSITDSTGCPGLVVNTSIVTGSILSTGETICVGGAPGAITSIAAFGGDGQLSYSWYKDGELIPGATAADYTPPVEDADTVGVYTYTRRVKDQTCNLTPLASEGSWVLTVNVPPAAPAASSPQTFCSADNLTVASLSATGTAIKWYADASNGASLTPTTALTNNTTYYASQTINGCESTRTAVAVTITAKPSPSLSLMCGYANQPGYTNAALTLIYQTINATGATVTGLPSGMSTTWAANVLRISGTPTVSGTFCYTVSTTNTDGCIDASESGTITLAATSPTLPANAGTGLWVCGSQVWSEPVKIDECDRDREQYSYSNNIPDCHSYAHNGIKHYYYNWSYVDVYKDTMCPYPWRVPVLSDFTALISCLGSTTINGVYYPESSAWGGLLTGCTGNRPYKVEHFDVNAQYWSATGINATLAYIIYFEVNTIRTDGGAIHGYARPVRCVRDAQ
ncbi:MAG: hypothetical protein LBD91_00370, partial [Prevotellaceae bacterium]|nr:hypothetical protein [Prevotellaceae bacterium]